MNGGLTIAIRMDACSIGDHCAASGARGVLVSHARAASLCRCHRMQQVAGRDSWYSNCHDRGRRRAQELVCISFDANESCRRGGVSEDGPPIFGRYAMPPLFRPWVDHLARAVLFFVAVILLGVPLLLMAWNRT